LIVSGIDNRNIAVTLDIVQAKLLVELLRLPDWPDAVRSSNAVQKDGFVVLATDADAARSSFVAVLGQYLRGIVHVSKLQEPAPTEPSGDDVPPEPVN